MNKYFCYGYLTCMTLLLFIGSILSISAITHDFSIHDAPYDMVKISNLTENELQNAYIDTVHYLYDARESLNTEKDGAPLFSKKEISHMKDVKKIFQMLIHLFWFLLLLLVCATHIFIQNTIPNLSKVWILQSIKRFFWSVIIFFLGLALALIFFFEPLFIIFHQLTFQNNDWLLSLEHDHLIQFLPEQFFFKRALQIALLFAVLFTSVIITLYAYIKRYKQNTGSK